MSHLLDEGTEGKPPRHSGRFRFHPTVLPACPAFGAQLAADEELIFQLGDAHCFRIASLKQRHRAEITFQLVNAMDAVVPAT